MSNAAYGRWDLRVLHPSGEFPSWAELTPEGGQFVGQVGSARPIKTIAVDGASVKFGLPPQYEGRKTDLAFEGTVDGDTFTGTCLADDGTTVPFSGKRAPAMVASGVPTWGEPVSLIGSDLSNWVARTPSWANNWKVEDGCLVNTAGGSDLVTTDKFTDFKLEAEYHYPKDSNSGIYLRGRYEFQILDDFGSEPRVGSSGAIYGFLAPKVNAVKPFGETNNVVITLIGRQVTVVLNGVTVVDGEIPGITGGALDSEEGTPGPLFVQGDHGPVTFTKLVLTPAK